MKMFFKFVFIIVLFDSMVFGLNIVNVWKVDLKLMLNNFKVVLKCN